MNSCFTSFLAPRERPAYRLLGDPPGSFSQLEFPGPTRPCCCLSVFSSAMQGLRAPVQMSAGGSSRARPLIYSVGTAGHLSCNKNKMSLWPRASNPFLNPHFKKSYYTRVRLNQTKLQCLRCVAHFQILLYLSTSFLETQWGVKQNHTMIIYLQVFKNEPG